RSNAPSAGRPARPRKRAPGGTREALSSCKPTMPEIRLYRRMQPAANPGLAIDRAAHPAAVIDDFDAVVRQYWPRVFRFALASLRDRDAAESVAQDCFVRAHQHRARFRG